MSENPDALALKLSVAKNLIDRDLAQEVYRQCQAEGASAIAILQARGIITPHIAEKLRQEVALAQEPKTIGGYRIVAKLGQGGMGAVYKAVQVSMEREVALKVISPEFARDQEARDRFLREAKSAGRVNHPNVITCYDTGQEGATLYQALELVTGGDVDKLMKRSGGRLPIDRALDIIADAAAGLAAIHAAGLVHRDLKPANLFLTESGQVKVADLGLARTTQGDDRMTMSGAAVGTPAFMSPEQAQGLPDVDIRTDIYALGATLYDLIAGQAPYRGTSPYDVVAKVLNDPTPDLRALVPEASDAVADLIARCMAKDRAQRFATPAELEQAVRAVRAGSPAGRPVAASRPGTPRPRQASGGSRTRPTMVPAKPASAPAPAPRSPIKLVLAIAGTLAALACLALVWSWQEAKHNDPMVNRPPPRPPVAETWKPMTLTGTDTRRSDWQAAWGGSPPAKAGRDGAIRLDAAQGAAPRLAQMVINDMAFSKVRGRARMRAEGIEAVPGKHPGGVVVSNGNWGYYRLEIPPADGQWHEVEGGPWTISSTVPTLQVEARLDAAKGALEIAGLALEACVRPGATAAVATTLGESTPSNLLLDPGFTGIGRGLGQGGWQAFGMTSPGGDQVRVRPDGLPGLELRGSLQNETEIRQWVPVLPQWRSAVLTARVKAAGVQTGVEGWHAGMLALSALKYVHDFKNPLSGHRQLLLRQDQEAKEVAVRVDLPPGTAGILVVCAAFWCQGTFTFTDLVLVPSCEPLACLPATAAACATGPVRK